MTAAIALVFACLLIALAVAGIIGRLIPRREKRGGMYAPLFLPSIAPDLTPNRDPWGDVMWTHNEVVDRLPASIRDDFRPLSPLAPFGISGEALCRGWLTANEARTFHGDTVEVRDLADPEPRYLVIRHAVERDE